MLTVYEILCNHIGEDHVERIYLRDCVLYKIWNIHSIGYEGIVTDVGRSVSAYHFASLDEMDILDDRNYEDDGDYFTSDPDFYYKHGGCFHIGDDAETVAHMMHQV